MLTTQHSVAKQAARRHFRGTHMSAASVDSDKQPIPLDLSLAGIGVGKDTIRIYVLEDRMREPDVPDYFEGLPSEVILTTGFKASATARRRPSPCGVSGGHVKVKVGTLGCLVERDGLRYVLSNNHVIADTNNGMVNDVIVQPGPTDGGQSGTDSIATLDDFEPIDFARTAINHLDAAIAQLSDSASMTPDVVTIGMPVNPPVSAAFGQTVIKHGRTTRRTTGAVVDVSFDGYVDYSGGRTAWFEDQILVESPNKPFAQLGDSGSLIVDDPGFYPVALLFACDNKRALGNPIAKVLSRFCVTVVDK